MNIDQEIQDLLYRNNCVIVPGFGAFISTNISAQLTENHNFTPPTKQISFNSNILNNDGLLVNYVAQSKSISYEDALQLVQNNVENWNNKLNLINNFYIKNVGSFFKNENGNIIFESDSNNNYLSSSFGLSTLVSPLIEKEIFVQPKTTIINSNIDSKKVTPLNKEKVSTYNMRKIFKYAAIFLISLGICTIAFLFSYNMSNEKKKQIAEKNAQLKVERKISEANFILPLLEYKNYTYSESYDNKYYIIAGSFSKLINAEKLKKELETSGYNATIIPRNNNMFSVTYKYFTTELEAETYRKKIQKSINPDAWVLHETK